MGKSIKIKYNNTYTTAHSRDYYRGASFHWSGKWLIGAHYISDDYNVDFVVYKNVLLACAKSHLSALDNEPSDFIKDENGNIIGVVSIYWDFILSGISGKSPGIKIVDNYWYTCDNIDVPIEEQVWVNTGVKAKFEFSDLTPEEIEQLEEPARQIVEDFVDNVIVQESGQNTDKLMSQKAVTDALNTKISTSDLNSAISNEVIRADSAYQPKGDYITETQFEEAVSDIDDSIDGLSDSIDFVDDRISSVEEVIPNSATASNQLADKNFVNSSIATNTADFKGTFNSISELEEVTADNNDYAFVVSVDLAGNTIYNRYKYNGTAWVYEYTLNNSSFTANQWAAIQSGITSNLVSKLSDLPTNSELTTSLDNKVDKVSGKQLSTNDFTTSQKNKLNAIENNAQKNIIEGVQLDNSDLPIVSKKVNIDTAQLVDRTKNISVSDSFVYRQAGGGLIPDIKQATINSINGNSIVWNQQVQNGNFADGTAGWIAAGATLSAVDGILTWMANDASVLRNLTTSIPFVNGHKYYISFFIKGNADNQIGGAFGAVSGGGSFATENYSTSWKRIAKIATPTTNTVNALYLRPNTAGNDGAVADFRNICVHDLTLMFGAGNEPSTVEDFIKLFPASYYAYNEGTLVNCTTTYLKVVGFNQWDEIYNWSGVNVNTGQPGSWNNRIASYNFINVLPSTTYYFKGDMYAYILFYDSNQTYIGYVSIQKNATNRTFTTPANAAFIKFSDTGDTYGSSVYNDDICINLSWDGYRNGEYKSYWMDALPINIASLTGKLNGAGTSVTIVPDGLKSASTAHDYGIVENGYLTKIVKCVGKKTFDGTESWGNTGSQVDGYFTSAQKFVTLGFTNHKIQGCLLCNKLTIIISSTQSEGMWQGGTGNEYFYIRVLNSKVTSNDELKTWLETQYTLGTPLEVLYELDTPETYVLDTPVNVSYIVDNYCTEEVLSNSLVVNVPLVADINYLHEGTRDLALQSVKYTPQILTEGQQLQAKQNLGIQNAVSGDGISIIKSLSQSDYDALVNSGSTDPNTLYIIC